MFPNGPESYFSTFGLHQQGVLMPVLPINCDCKLWGPPMSRCNRCVRVQIVTPKEYLQNYRHHTILTSSTAQGGGGSFKNRKPIGEIGCCESGMAERIHWWTERCLRSPLFLSLSLTIYLPTNLSSMYLSIYRSIYLSLSLFHLITFLPIYLSIYLSLSFICLSV